MKKIQAAVRQLGMTSKYKGYYYVIEAVRIRMNEQRPYLITKEIYPVLARQFGTRVHNVEADIRRVSRLCWEKHRDQLILMAGHALEEAPSNRQFIDILAYYCLAS